MLGARAADSAAIIPKMPVVGMIGECTNGKASFERRCRLERRGTAYIEATRQGGNPHQSGCKRARSYCRCGSAEGNAGWNFLSGREEIRCSQEEVTLKFEMPGTRCPASLAGHSCPASVTAGAASCSTSARAASARAVIINQVFSRYVISGSRRRSHELERP